MSQQLVIRRRRKPTRNGPKQPPRTMQAAFARPSGGGAAALDYPGYRVPEDEGNTRTFVTGSLATLLHVGGVALLLFIASLAPVIEERLIAVQILHEEPVVEPEPAPAPRALAERRMLEYAPAVQAVTPQVVNPRVIAEAVPTVTADAVRIDAADPVVAPTNVSRSNVVVERVAAVNSAVRARVASVDVANTAAPTVRGPTRVESAGRPSVGPRRVTAANVGTTLGTGPLRIGAPSNGSSVREGVLTDRDVLGSPEGLPVVSVNTTIGEGFLRGSGGDGTGIASPTPAARSACFQRPEVQSYLVNVKDRTVERWVLPPGLVSGQTVTLRFRLDVAGSATTVSLVEATDNTLGASAVDALRAAAPFPPMNDSVRCLTQVPILATFTNPVAG